MDIIKNFIKELETYKNNKDFDSAIKAIEENLKYLMEPHFHQELDYIHEFLFHPHVPLIEG